LTSYFAQMQDVPVCAPRSLGMARWRGSLAELRLTGDVLVHTL
jgi:hypothetical protein